MQGNLTSTIRRIKEKQMSCGASSKSIKSDPIGLIPLIFVIVALFVFKATIVNAEVTSDLLALEWEKLRAAKSVLTTGGFAGARGVRRGDVPEINDPEERFLRSACLYHTERHDQISELIDILKASDFRPDPRPPLFVKNPFYKGKSMDEWFMETGGRYIFTLADNSKVRLVYKENTWFITDPPKFNGFKLRAYDIQDVKLERWLFYLPPATLIDSSTVDGDQCEIIRNKRIYELGM